MGNTTPQMSTGTLPTACPTPPPISNAVVNVTHNVATYKCNDGYTIKGSPNNMTCVLGQWKGYPPDCIVGTFLDEDPNLLLEDMPLWLALTLAAVGVAVAALIACCCVALCCFNKKRDKEKDVEEVLTDGPVGRSKIRSIKVGPKKPDDIPNTSKVKAM